MTLKKELYLFWNQISVLVILTVRAFFSFIWQTKMRLIFHLILYEKLNYCTTDGIIQKALE
jgi:hypothetical protein